MNGTNDMLTLQRRMIDVEITTGERDDADVAFDPSRDEV